MVTEADNFGRDAKRSGARRRASAVQLQLELWDETLDHDAIEAASEPVGTAFAVVAQGGLLATLGYVPWLAERVQLPQPWLPVVVTLLGGVLTVWSHRQRARGLLGFALTMVDNSFYSTALVLAAVQASPRWGLGLAVIHGMMVLAFPARVYGLSFPFAVAMGLPLVVGFSVAIPSAVVTTVLLATYAMVLVHSRYTLTRIRIVREQARLREAVEATGRLADESAQLAFSQVSLGMGHFLHELRNAQAVQQLNLQVLENDMALPDEAREVVRDLIEAQTHEEELIVRTLDELRGDGAGQREPFDVVALLQRCAEREEIVQLGPVGEELWVAGAAHHLEVALTNLARNASQAGASLLQARLRGMDHGALELTLSDDGPGLSPAQAQRAFEPFSATTKTEGTGLGLYLTRRYVELLGGRIELLRSGPLGGACFRIVLPTCPAPNRASS